MSYKILERDPYLKPYEQDIELRMQRLQQKSRELLGDLSLVDFANGHHYFGFHKTAEGWWYREWAPGADAMYLMGDMNGWNPTGIALQRKQNGVFEVLLTGQNALYHGCKVKAVVEKDGQRMERIPLYARRVVQDPKTAQWAAEIDDQPYRWKKNHFAPAKKLFIYECHIGMAQEKEGIGSYAEFTEKVLPRVKKLGYNCIQIMAIMEHPYYGSFGYQVSSFFAASSRFGPAGDLKRLIDTAHGMGIAVLLDVVHSHAVKNVGEGLNRFDGTDWQFFHQGQRGEHPAWDTKLFDYGKNEVLHFLLSNLKFWMEEYHFDGFRFDGVTSMIYHDHGLGGCFDHYSKYFSPNTDTETITYLQLANRLVHQLNPNAITVAEDMSGMPGMALPVEEGGIGFDYRLAMGVPDMWTRLLRDSRDEDWSMGRIWYELSTRRPGEKNIGYAESHDQALVGDKTIMFWLCDSAMYTRMSKLTPSAEIDRGIALHKMIRLATLALAGEGYLNFMGNEFGHPEWIDFPREGNGWSYFYCRRQWHLADDPLLKYGWLEDFDRAMLAGAKNHRPEKQPRCLCADEAKQVLVFERGGLLFAFNFSPGSSYKSYFVPTGGAGRWQPVLSTDEGRFGGWDRIAMEQTYRAAKSEQGQGFGIYLPARTAVCLARLR